MAKKQYLDLTGLTTYDEQIKAYIDAGDDAKAPASHSHTITATATDDDVIVLTFDAKHVDSGVTAGTYKSVTVNAKGHVTSGSNPTTISGYGITDAYTKTQVDSALNGKAASDHKHDNLYDAKGAASNAQTAAINSAKTYTDEKIANLLDNSTEAVDSIVELAEAMKDNAGAITALEEIAAGKAPATHSHAISDVTDLQSALNDKAAQTSLDTHIGNGDIHVTADLKGNWNTAYTHSQANHAPAGAQANVIETIKVNGTALTPISKAVNITVPTDYLVAADIANKADKSTTLAGYGITNAYTKTEVDSKLSAKANQTSLDSVSSVANNAKTAADTNTQSIAANTQSINTHTSQISALQTLVGDGIEPIPDTSITALFTE